MYVSLGEALKGKKPQSKRLLIITLAVVCASPLVAQSLPVKEFGQQSGAEVAIFYDGPTQALAEGYLDANQIASLLGHFNLRAKIVPIADSARKRRAAGRLVGDSGR